MRLKIFTFTDENCDLIKAVEAEYHKDAVKDAKDPRITMVTEYTSRPLRRKFAITMKQNINSFCPHCGKILWEELGRGDWFDCKQCKREISIKKHTIVSALHIQKLEKNYNENKGDTMENPRRNGSGQPYGVVLEEFGNRYAELVFGYYDGRARRFNLSVSRMEKNFQNDLERTPDKYSSEELALIKELKAFDTQGDEHIQWLKKAFELQHNKEDVLPLVKEVADEIDYTLSNEHSGFLNDVTYQQFRQELIGELAKVYDEPIKFLGVIIRTIALSVGAVIEDFEQKIAC